MRKTGKGMVSGVLGALLIPLVFIADLITPLGYAEWLLYIIPLLITSWTGNKKAIIFVSSLSTILLVAGFFLSKPGVELQIAIFNRVAIILLIWVLAVLLIQRRVADEKVEKSEALFRRIFEQSPMGISLFDKNGILLEANKAANQIFGAEDPGALKGINLFDNPNIPSEVKKNIKKGNSLAFEISYNFDEVRKKRYFRTGKSGIIYLHEVITPVIYGDEAFSKGYLMLVEDITERKQAEEKLNSTIEELDRSNRELERFAYVASHDLQEPLRMVASYTQLLEKRYRGKLDSEADLFIRYAVEGANRMKNLIEDLLTYSRLSRQAEMKETDLNYVIKSVCDVLKLSFRETGAKINVDPLPYVLGNETQLFQLFQNLISNALKFRNSRIPEITVRVERENNHWVISVSDNGIGIDPEYFKKIFIVFQRLHSGNKYQGTGIGLAICKRIVENHGGEIWVKSSPGMGSSFYFSLPVNTEPI